jgi:glutamate formiminotransferase/formiminotetrahydrofolate cyclodeaminase
LAAFRLPKDTPEQAEQRNAAIEAATLGATRVPLLVAYKAVRVMELAVEAIRIGNLNAITDAGTGALLAKAALGGAGLNVRVNAKNLADQVEAEKILAELASLDQRAKELESQVRSALVERGGLPAV